MPVLFLHGFTGSSADWEIIFRSIDDEFYPFGIDLIGHGESSTPQEVLYYNHKSVTQQINDVLDYLGINQVILCGYSMGGRAALSFYFACPGRVAGLVLESTNPGIQDETEREKRVQSDSELINRIQSNGIEEFIDFWYSLPLFESLENIPSRYLDELISRRYKNNVAGLCNSLAGFGTGVMPDYWEKLKEINIPVQLITGEIDEKYKALSFRVAEQIRQAELDIIKSAGHNTHLEKPAEFVSLVNSFLRNNFVQ